MRILLFILVLIPQAYATECSMRNVLSQNTQLMPPDKEVIEPVRGQGGFINPFYTGPSSTSEGIAEMPSVRKARLLTGIQPRPMEEAVQIISEIRESMIRVIAGTGAQSPHQRLMISRIKDLTIQITDCQGAEGSNDSTTYEIKLCQNALKMPKLALVSLVAHEIGHSLDLCNLGSRRYQNPMTGGRFLDTTDVEKTNAEITDQGIPLHENPLLSAYTCLNRTNSYYSTLPDDRRSLCSDTMFTESGAQIWAARATGEFVKSHPPTREEAIGLFANSMTGMNKGTTNKEQDIDTIYFADPEIRSIFGCTPKPTQHCLESFRPENTRSLATLINSVTDLGSNPVQPTCGSNNP